MDLPSKQTSTQLMDVNLSDWLVEQKKRLAAEPIGGYAPGESPMAEPVALAAITACAYDLSETASTLCHYMQQAQNRDGSVSVGLNTEGPFWTTSLACIAWRQFELHWPELANPWCRDSYRRGLDFLFQIRGEKVLGGDTFGHDTQLVGWPWVEGTHSWIEPTAMALMAMRHCGAADHPRAIEAFKLLSDRQLPTGGANYGNTFVLGNKLRPHVLPSAMCIVAVHRVTPIPESFDATIRYLENELNRPMAAISLAWTIHALVSSRWNNVTPFDLELDWPLRAAINRLRTIEVNPYRQNLLMLAARMQQSPLLAVEPDSFFGLASGVKS
ncbi:hypothetical protein CA13_38810 [Planctomycetes bacterium CA13]|uniref:Prenyltransferase and squalene oxidase repeat protein n=1 Tax=Novipirellula herctigrandis TaxID=2527986 RepID=A0A5C5Z520_9BACT|nr:hypothetical protein CA13_38810 [Planctomycetes bacterium CA13]